MFQKAEIDIKTNNLIIRMIKYPNQKHTAIPLYRTAFERCDVEIHRMKSLTKSYFHTESTYIYYDNILMYISYEGYSGWLYQSYQYHPECYPWSHFNGYNMFNCIDIKYCKYKHGLQESDNLTICSECKKSRTLYNKNITDGIDDIVLKAFVNYNMYTHSMLCYECNTVLYDIYYNCDDCIGYIRDQIDDLCKDDEKGDMRSEYNLCEMCYNNSVHSKEHSFTELKVGKSTLITSATIIQIIKRNNVINKKEFLQFVQDTKPIILYLSKYKKKCIGLLRNILDDTTLHIKDLHNIIEDYIQIIK